MILDPACGSGNFLTESYLSLRKLENRILESLMGDQMGMGFEGENNPIQVSIDQFYGIEINDFAVAVAKTALWIAEEQMMDVTQEILFTVLDFLPLSSNDNIHEGNALRMDWNTVLPSSLCDFIIGNPPFLGHQDMTVSQHSDLDIVLSDCNKHGKLDYVAGWYAKAIQYIQDKPISCAFVSTNSICQGEQVSILWDYLFNKGAEINFAYHSFIWNNEATDQAHVHCVIVGFNTEGSKEKKIFNEHGFEKVDTINGYLFDGPKKSIASRSKNINRELVNKKLVKGSQPTDGGFLLFKKEEGESFIEKYPTQAKFVKKYIGADEFINGKYRYCLWLVDANPNEYEDNPEIKERLEEVKAVRLASPTASVRRDANTPQLFTQIRQPETQYLLFPRHSSGRRKYLPIGFVEPDVIASDAASFIPGADLYLFGMLSSEFHNAWMRTVCGRLKSDYRYSPAVYNSFVFPNPTPEQKQKIEQLAQDILDIRDLYPDKSLADLYDPDKMPSDLLNAHKELDKAVEDAYGIDFNGDEEKIVSHLFKLYADATKGL